MVAVLQRPTTEGVTAASSVLATWRTVEGLTERPSKAVDRPRTKQARMTRSISRVRRAGADDLGRAVAAGPRDIELDVAELGQKMPPPIAGDARRAYLDTLLIQGTW